MVTEHASASSSPFTSTPGGSCFLSLPVVATITAKISPAFVYSSLIINCNHDLNANSSPLAIPLTLIVSNGGICMEAHLFSPPSPREDFQSATHWARNPFSATRLPFAISRFPVVARL